eukprot:6196141-Pleurochrysis_carterae.AAC.3
MQEPSGADDVKVSRVGLVQPNRNAVDILKIRSKRLPIRESPEILPEQASNQLRLKCPMQYYTIIIVSRVVRDVSLAFPFVPPHCPYREDRGLSEASTTSVFGRVANNLTRKEQRLFTGG